MTHEMAADAVSFLVVADAGESGWAVEVAQVDGVLPPDDSRDAVDAARFGFPGDPESPARVVRLRSAARSAGVVVRRHLAIVTVPRDDIHALPPLLVRAMRERTFASVVFSEQRAPFLIVDIEALLGGLP